MTTTELLADIYPATLSPWPAEVPQRRVRAVVTDSWAVVLWEGPQRTVQRHYLPVDGTAREAVTASGGTVGGVSVARSGGCRCGARAVQSADWRTLAP